MQPIIFFGSAPISNVVLQKLIDAKVPVTAVVTKPDKPVGRHLKLTPNPVKTLALQNKIKVYDSLSDLDVAKGIIGLVAAYGKIIPQKVLDKFNIQIYNIHPSLLPKYRGPSPLQQQILDGVTETGITIIQIDEKMDHGPIVAQEKDELLPDDTTQSLGKRLFTRGTDLFLKTQDPKYKIHTTEQDHSQATYTKLLTRQDGFIPYDQFSLYLSDSTQNHYDPHSYVSRLFRAYHPWPGIWSLDPQGRRVKLVSLPQTTNS